MSQAGWIFVEWTSATSRFSKLNWTMNPHKYGVANVENVTIELAPESREQLMPAATALANAFKQIGIDATVTGKNNNSTNAGVIDLLLGAKS
jgi:ABC-type transport system substrate-binding protein